MKFLVTGGAGFIGSHLTDRLLTLQECSEVRILDHLGSGRIENIESALKRGGKLILGDVRDRDAVFSAAEGCDIIFHLAAVTSVQGSIADPITCEDVNVKGTLNVLSAAREFGVKRVVFASSSAVYGEIPVQSKNEKLPPDPLSPYAASKLAGEIHCRIHTRLYGIETACMRYFNVFGPRQDPASPYAAVIPKFLAAVQGARSPVVYGDGEQTRDFVFVDNVVEANIQAARKPGLRHEIFNVGTGTSVSLNQVLQEISTQLGTALYPTFEPAAPGDIRHSLADIARIRSQLDFIPKVSFQEGLRRMLSA